MVENLVSLVLDGLALGCIYALIALGYTMVYGIIKLINFAHGEFFMIAGYAALAVLAAMPSSQWTGFSGAAAQVLAAMLAAATAAAIVAVTVEKVAYRPLRRASRIAALLTALGVSLFLQNAALKVFSPNTRSFRTSIEDRRYPRIAMDDARVRGASADDFDVYWTDTRGNEQFLGSTGDGISETTISEARSSGARAFYYYPRITIRRKQIIIWVSAATMATVLYLLVNRTGIGRAMRAVSYDFETAELMGINVDRVISFTFLVGAVLAGVAAVLVGMYYGALKPTIGVMYGLKAFVAAVLGGIGSIPGALAGALALGVAESMVKLNSHTAPYQDAFAFAVLVAILVFRPNGFFGTEEREKV